MKHFVDQLKREFAAELQRYKNGLMVLNAENERLKAELRELRSMTAITAQSQHRGGSETRAGAGGR
jgi:cell shape-determining protein MreC